MTVIEQLARCHHAAIVREPWQALPPPERQRRINAMEMAARSICDTLAQGLVTLEADELLALIMPEESV